MSSIKPIARVKKSRTWRIVFMLGFLAFVIREAGCDYNITTNPDKSLVVATVSPQAAALYPGRSITFTALIANAQKDSSLTWSLSDPTIGTLSIVGGSAIYTAPSSISGPATSVSIIVQSKEDATKTSRSVITIVNPDTTAKLLLDPVAVTISPGRSQQFSGLDLGLGTASVTWQLVSGFGSVNASGLFTAPASLTSLPSFGIIRATSTSDQRRFADATITIANATDSLICFQRDVLPILAGNCGTSGCHTPGGGPGDLTSYDGVIGRVVPGSARSSRLYLAATDFKISGRMPPPPRPMLSPPQVVVIGRWIDQGAQNTNCSNASDCDTTLVYYSSFVRSTMSTYCVGCHAGSNAGGGIDLSNYSGLAATAANGKLTGSITFSTGFSPMPKGGPRLDDCTIAKIRAWVNRGYPND
jgi:hypothetical protein